MISFSKFISLKEALSLDDPLAQSILKIKSRNPTMIIFEFNLDNDNYQINIYKNRKAISIESEQHEVESEQHEVVLDIFKLMHISLTVNNSYLLTNKMGMQANIIYNMLLNAIKQAHDHFGEIDGYEFSGANRNQDLMYDRLMKRFAPNLIAWEHYNGIHLKPESVQKLKDKNPHMIEKINDKIHQETSEKEIQIQKSKENKALRRSLRRQQP
jgi:hypothetical protein